MKSGKIILASFLLLVIACGESKSMLNTKLDSEKSQSSNSQLKVEMCIRTLTFTDSTEIQNCLLGRGGIIWGEFERERMHLNECLRFVDSNTYTGQELCQRQCYGPEGVSTSPTPYLSFGHKIRMVKEVGPYQCESVMIDASYIWPTYEE